MTSWRLAKPGGSWRRPWASRTIATAISEIARNIFTYAREGAIEISTVEDGPQSGIEVIARDEGPGEGTMVTSRTWLKS